jgi:hypothetical protein
VSSENIVDQETDNPELEQTLKEQQHDAFLFFVRNLWYFFSVTLYYLYADGYYPSKKSNF